MNNLINRNIRSIALLVFGLIGLTTLAPTTKAQDVAGRIAFGIDAGLNKYYGNYTDNQFALHGDAFIRWNIFDWLSLHAAYNAGQLKYKAATATTITSTSTTPRTHFQTLRIVVSFITRKMITEIYKKIVKGLC